MSAPRRPAGPVRQLSLQQPPRRQQIRRQRSADEEKPLQIYANPIRTRFCGSPKPDINRPKVRIAWGEQKGNPSDDQVEIVARQIPGKSRPPTSRALKNSSRPSITEKATVLYSRQELAERLRLAWKQREENKSNIDIFLAHNTVEDRCDSQLSTCTSVATPPTPFPNESDKRRQKLQKVENSISNIVATFADPKVYQSLETETEREIDINVGEIEVQNKDEETIDNRMEDDEMISLQNEDQKLTHQSLKIEPNDVEKAEERKETHSEESVITEKKKSCISIDWSSTTEEDSVSKLSTFKKDDSPLASYSAKLKRANFQSGLNKAFVGPIIEKTMTLKVADKIHNSNELKFRRTSSAPPIRRPMSVSASRTQVSIVIDAPVIIKNEFSDKVELKLHERKDTLTMISSGNEPPIKSAISHRPIKSAPIKRRTKSGKRRGLAIGSKDGDNDNLDKPRGSRGKANLENKVTDVVTMVSLISSVDSDSDVDENSLKDDQLIHELRNKLPTTPIIKSSTNSAVPNSRRPIKSGEFICIKLLFIYL